MTKINRASASAAAQILYKALEYGKPIDILIVGGKKDAESYRFKLYNARKTERIHAAEYQQVLLKEVKHELDSLSITCVEKSPDQWVVRLMPVTDFDLKIVDTETGAELSIAYMPDQLTEEDILNAETSYGMD